MFTTAKKYDSLIYYIYICPCCSLQRLIGCAFSVRLSATNGCVFFFCLSLPVVAQASFPSTLRHFPVKPTFQPQPHCQIGGNDNYFTMTDFQWYLKTQTLENVSFKAITLTINHVKLQWPRLGNKISHSVVNWHALFRKFCF